MTLFWLNDHMKSDGEYSPFGVMLLLKIFQILEYIKFLTIWNKDAQSVL